MYTFLPKNSPLKDYTSKSESLNLIKNIATELPKLLLTNTVRKKISNLNKNDFSIDELIQDKNDSQEIRLAMAQIS